MIEGYCRFAENRGIVLKCFTVAGSFLGGLGFLYLLTTDLTLRIVNGVLKWVWVIIVALADS